MNIDVQQRVLKVLSEVLDNKDGQIGLDTSIRDDLRLDSLQQMTLFIALEDEFQQSIPPETAQDLVTVGDVISFVECKLTLT